jgi:hypothetical protein
MDMLAHDTEDAEIGQTVCTRLVVVNRHGEPRMVLECLEDHMPALTLFDRRGRPRLSLYLHPDSGEAIIRAFDEQGRQAVMFTNRPHGRWDLVLRDQDGRMRRVTLAENSAS